MSTNSAVAEGKRRAVAPYIRLLSLRETMVLANIVEREKEVRNDIHRGVLPAGTVIRMDNAHLCFNWPDVLTFAAVYGNRYIDSIELRRVAFERVSNHTLGDFVCPRAVNNTSFNTSFSIVSEVLWPCVVSRDPVEIDRYLNINILKVCEEVKPRVDLYAFGLKRVEEKNSVLGGSAVFSNTRISVAHIGKMAERGVAITEILEDYPQLTEGDVSFARLYYRARPPVGRPRTSGAVRHVELNTK
jgi:uncharacterized protein (DUF433 family)